MRRLALIRRFWPYVLEYKGKMIIGIVLMVSMVFMDLVQPLPLKILFDNVIGNHELPGILQPVYNAVGSRPLNLLLLVTSSVILLALIDGGITYLGQSRVTNLGQRVVFDMRRDLYSHMQR